MRGIFYYPWYPSHWAEAPHITPALGHYDSLNRKLIRAHITMMQWAGIDFGIASWWDRGDDTDKALPILLDEGRRLGFKWAVHYEPELASAPSHFPYLQGLTAHSAYLKRDRPVMFVWNTWTPEQAVTLQRSWPQWHLVTQAAGGVSEYRYAVKGNDGLIQRIAVVNRQCFTSLPGFWRGNEAAPQLGRDPAQFHYALTWAKATEAAGWPWQLITSFNEWPEGTGIEPSDLDPGLALQAVRSAWA